MRDNKNKVMMIVAIIIVVVIAVILAVVLGGSEEFTLSGNNNIATSLEASGQAEIDEIIKKDLETNNYKLNNARIYLNPYGNSPLSALIAFKSDTETDVTVTIKGKHDDDIVLKYGKATYHYIPVFGLYLNHNNEIKIKLGSGAEETIRITTGKLEFAPTAIVNTSEVPKNEQGFYFITTPLNMRSFALDAHGEVRWYSDAMYFHNIEPLDNGHILVGTGNVTKDGLANELIEIDLLGRVYNTYDIEEGYLNDFIVKNDGNIILASKNPERDTYSEYIVEIDDETGKIVKTWDVYKTLEDIDPVFINEIDRDDYFYNSGIEYNESSNSLLLTYWGGEFVINLNYDNGSIKWIFANPKNLSSAFAGYLLQPSENFEYPKAMHSASLSGDTLKVFDNGYSTIDNVSNSANLVGSYSRAVTYKLNGNKISEDKVYDEDKKFFSYALGDYEIVNTMDEIILFGRELKDLDFSTGMNINDYDNVVSRLIEKRNGETVLDLEIGWATYSVVKVNVSSSYTFEFTEPNAYTTLEPSPKESITDSVIDAIENATETLEYEFGYSSNMIEHNVLFMTVDEAKLVLINDNNEGAVYTLKVKNETESKKIVTDLAKGKYYVFVLENGTMYKTDSYIEIK